MDAVWREVAHRSLICFLTKSSLDRLLTEHLMITSLFMKGAVIIGCTLITACGLRIPEVQELGEPLEGQRFVQSILFNIKCDLRDALTTVREQTPEGTFLDSWGVQTTLTLTYDEKGSLAPGVVWTPPGPTSAIFSLAGGLNYSADASRKTVINSYYLVSELNKIRCEDKNRANGAFLLQNDLKVKDTLSMVLGAQVTNVIDFKQAGLAAPADVVQSDIKFEVTTGGSITPSYKLTRVNINPSSDFLTASRTRTHDLLITFAPAAKSVVEDLSKSGRVVRSVVAQPSRQGSDIHFSTLVAGAIETGIKSALQR